MTKQEVISMEQYYKKIYGLPKDDNDAIDILLRVYKKLFNLRDIQESDKQGIAEYYRILQAKDLPAYTWLLEVFHHVSKKSPSKHGFNYMVGIIRQWMIHGFGHIPSYEEEELMMYFLEITKLTDASIDAKRIIKNLMGTYGIIKVTRMIGDLESQDASRLFAKLLMDRMREKYEVAGTQPVVETTAVQAHAQIAATTHEEEFLIPVESVEKVYEERSNPPFKIGEVLQFQQREAIDEQISIEAAEVETEEPNRKSVAVAIAENQAAIRTRNTPEYRDQLLKESIIVEDAIRNIGSGENPVRLTHIKEKTQREVHWGSNYHEKMSTLLKYNSNIYKHAKGVYAIHREKA